MLSYPARLAPAGEKMVLLTLPDVPEAVVVAASEDEAIEKAPEILEGVLGGYVVEGRSIPSPSDICGAPVVTTERFSVLGMERG
jgi:antitoxin HicB